MGHSIQYGNRIMDKGQLMNYSLAIIFLFVFLSLSTVHGMEAFPSTAKGFLVKQRKPLIGASALVAGLAFKKSYDGPVFNSKDIDLTGKTIVITGANTGLGKESALSLAGMGMPEVILLCRNPEKAQAAVDDIKIRTKNPNVRYIICDLSDLKSVKDAADQVKKSVARLDVLQLNSGVMAIPQRETTKDGFEKHMGINHLGHFALTALLFDLLKKSKNSRVVTVSSSAHLLGNLDKDNLMLEGESYQPWPAYGNSKLANILFTRELNRRLVEANNPWEISSVVLHPGACRTELGRYLFDPESIPKYLLPVLGVVGSPLLYFTKDARMGSQTQTYLSASPQITPKEGGKFYDNSAVAKTSAEANDIEEAKWLWMESERLTGIKFDVS